MRILLATLLVLVSSTARAERFGIAVNQPLFWSEGLVGASAYVGLGHQHALRVNVAKHRAPGTLVSKIAAAAVGGEEIDRGGYFDAGVGWQWYPRRLWQGPTLELGLLYRADNSRNPDSADIRPDFEISRDAHGVLARGLVGWSWLWYDRVFIMTAVGAAAGYERGTEEVQLDDYITQYTRRSPAFVATPEWYLRFGWNF